MSIRLAEQWESSSGGAEVEGEITSFSLHGRIKDVVLLYIYNSVVALLVHLLKRTYVVPP